MEICTYVNDMRGKRFRPLIVILAHKFVGGKKPDEIIPLASGIELIHTATLIHDDMNDKSKFRRGVETVYSKFGTSRALIMGDFLFAIGFKLGGSYGKKVVEVVAELSSKLAEGEFLHLKYLRNPNLSEDIYLDIIERKTAGPIIGGAKIGAIVGDGTDSEIEKIGEFGRAVGIAFQIKDDIFDVTGITSELGKSVGVDLKNGKLTLLTIAALKELEGASRKRLEEIILLENAPEEDYQEAVDLIKSTSAIDYAEKKARSFIDSALDTISTFESNEIYPSLEALARYTVERKT
jgi:octaprenyl-diphosphate synthase